MNMLPSRLRAGVVGLAILVAACGGAPAIASTAPSASPSVSPSPSLSASTSAVSNVSGDAAKALEQAFSAVQTEGLAAVPTYTCAANRDDLAKVFGGASFTSLTALGVKPEELLAAVAISFSNLKITSATETGDTATVNYDADFKTVFDADKMRAIFKTVLAAQGKPTDDATLDAIMKAMEPRLTTTKHVTEDVKLVKENGQWLICDSWAGA